MNTLADKETVDGRTKVQDIPLPMLKKWLHAKVRRGIIEAEGNGWLFGWMRDVNIEMKGGKSPPDKTTKRARDLYRSVRYDFGDDPVVLIDDDDDNPAGQEQAKNYAEF